MRLLQIVTAVSVVLSATAARGQSAVTGSRSCDLPQASGVSSQQLVSGSAARATVVCPARIRRASRARFGSDLHGSGERQPDQARNSGFEMVSASERFIVATLEAQGGLECSRTDNRADDVATSVM
jgi:poly(3-hydroxybutyrate) depolymerase